MVQRTGSKPSSPLGMEQRPVLFSTKTGMPKEFKKLMDDEDEEPDQKPTFIDPADE